nr:hypothetical protein [Tanacetum cinerariifolium]
MVMDVVEWAMQAPLRNHFRDLPEADMKEILHQCMWETDSYKSHKDHMQLYEDLEKSMNCDHSEELAKDLAKVRKKKNKSRESPKMPPGSPPHQPPPSPPPAGPSRALGSFRAFGSSQVPPSPPPPPSTNQEGQSKGSAAPSSAKTAALAEYQAWTTTDIRLMPSISLTPADLQMDEDMAPDEQAQSSNDKDIMKLVWSIPSSDVPVPTNNLASALASNYSPPLEDSLLAQTGDIAMFMDWFCKRRGITELKPQDLEGPAFEIVKVFHPDVIHLQYQIKECHKLLTDSVDASILRHNVSKPLPLGGPPGHDATCFKYKHDYTVIDSPRAVKFQDRYEVQMIMCFNEIHKFSDGTLQQIDEALDYRVKEFKINKMNQGLNTRFWTRKDVDRSKAFMFAIQKQLKTKRIFSNLESFVGGRVRDGDYKLLKRTE